MDITTSLLGLTNNEKSVYEAFLKKADLTAAEISREIGMDKSSAYRAAEDLVHKGLLISSPRKKGTTYLATAPDNLRKIYEQKLQELNSGRIYLDDYIAGLNRINSQKDNKTYIRIEYGVEALQKCMEESLASPYKLIKERTLRGHKSYLPGGKMSEFVIPYARRRVKLGIRIKSLENDRNLAKYSYREIMVNPEKYLKEIRFLPEDFNDNNSMRLCGDTVNIISYGANDELVVITVKDHNVAELLNNMFDFIWQRSEPYVHGHKGV